MKRCLKKAVAFMLAGCMVLINPLGVSADETNGTIVPDNDVQKYSFYDCDENTVLYDVGSSIANGMLEIKTDSVSLKKDCTIEIQINFNADNGFNLADAVMNMYYDAEILQYVNTDIKHGGNLWINEIHDNRLYLGIEFPPGAYFNQNDCIGIIQFKVKADTPSVIFYCGEIEMTGQDENTYPELLHYYYYEDTYYGEGNFKVMSLTINDTSAPSASFALSNTSAEGNGEITVPIDIAANDGFNLLGLTIDYDASLFTYEALEIAEPLQSKIALDSIYPTDGQIKASYIALEDITDVGNFLNLKLRTAAGISAGTSDVQITISQVGNKAETAMTGAGAVCTVTIQENGGSTPPVPLETGDVSGDGTIDLIDAVYILQYYNGVRDFSDAQTAAADVNNDGSLNLVDALMIMKYFNGEIDEF